MRNELRAMLPPLLSRLPDVRGRGRLTLLLDKLLTDPQDPSSYETVGTLNGGMRFHFDLRPWGQKFAYYYRSWEPEYVSMLRSLYRGGWFIDVGSSLGLYVVSMGPSVREHHGRIAAVEPVPFNQTRQRLNIALNGLEDLVDTAHVALGASPAIIRLAVDPMHADNNAFISSDGEVEVKLVTLDTLCRESGWNHVGTIKMDVEGYEPAVLEGARELFARDRPILLAEFNRERMAINGFTMDWSWTFLHDLGYQAYILGRTGRNLERIVAPGLHENMFFLPPGVAAPCLAD